MFLKAGDASAAFGSPSGEEEARGGVTEYREVVENSPAYLYCDSSAVPAPELTWYRGDQPLSAADADGVSVLQGRRGLQGEVGALAGRDPGPPALERAPSAALPRVLGGSPGCCWLWGPGQGLVEAVALPGGGATSVLASRDPQSGRTSPWPQGHPGV